MKVELDGLPQGFTLDETEDELVLFYENEKVAVFYPQVATPVAILKAAEEYLEKKKVVLLF